MDFFKGPCWPKGFNNSSHFCWSLFGGSAVKNPPAMQEMPVRSLGQEMATPRSTLAWKMPWTEEPGGLLCMGSQRVGHELTIKHTTHTTTSVALQCADCCRKCLTKMNSFNPYEPPRRAYYYCSHCTDRKLEAQRRTSLSQDHTAKEWQNWVTHTESNFSESLCDSPKKY